MNFGLMGDASSRHSFAAAPLYLRRSMVTATFGPDSELKSACVHCTIRA